MIRIITSKRLKKLENDSSMLFALKHKIDDVKNWCAYDSSTRSISKEIHNISINV